MLGQPLLHLRCPVCPGNHPSRFGDEATGCHERKQAKGPCGYVRTFLDAFRWHCHCNQEGPRSR